MEFPHDLPYSEVKDLLQAIIRRREERNTHEKDSHQYRMIDERLDELLELLAQRFMSAPTRGTERFPETLPPAEDEGEYHPTDDSHFDPAKELRLAVPSSLNETPPDLDTTPSETPEQKREREYLESIYAGGKPSAYKTHVKRSLSFFRKTKRVKKTRKYRK